MMILFKKMLSDTKNIIYIIFLIKFINLNQQTQCINALILYHIQYKPNKIIVKF